jgi:hypothetical protein
MNDMKPEKPIEASSAATEQDDNIPDMVENPVDSKSSDIATSSSSKEGGQVSIDFANTVNELLENPEYTAAQALENKFQENGIGNLGTLFRSLQKSFGLPGEEEVWSAFLELVSTLWQQDFHEASLKLLKDSLIRLSPPELYKNNISESITFGEDYIFYLRAKLKFEAGDQEGAKGLISQMSEENRGAMEKELERSSSALRKSRRNAFIGAGIAGAFCLVACVGSVLTFRNLVQNPHTMEIPTFEVPDIPLSLKNNDIDFQQTIQELIPDEFLDPDIYQPPTPQASSPDTTSETIFGDEEDASVPGEETGDFLPPVSEDSVDIFSSNTEQLEQSSLQSENEDIPEPREIDPRAVSNCGLAFRISTEAQRIVSLDEDAMRHEKAQNFQDAFFQACQSIPAALIQEAGDAYDDQEVLDYANGILSAE